MRSSALIGGVAAAALAGLLFGFDTAVVSGVTGALRNLFGLSPIALGITVSSALWGTLVGAMTGGIAGDRYGSRDGLKLMAVLYLFSGLGCALAWSWPALLGFRFIVGLAIGGSSVLAPVYICEIAPPSRRGALVGLFQINIVAGILVAYLSNFAIGALQLGADEWRWKLAASVLPAVLLFWMLRAAPQSPRWLVARSRTSEARATLAAIGDADPDAAIARISSTVAADNAAGGQTLSWRLHKKPILLAVTLAMFNQLAGINAILYYLNDIFAAAGYGKVSADMQAVAIGATNFAFTLLALFAIDRIGRKTLLLIGSVGMTAALAATAAIMGSGRGEEWLLLVLIGFIAFFAFSQGAVIWVYISEIFPTPVRARGQSLGSSTHWLMNALVSFAFPFVAAHSKSAPFAVFAAMMALQFFVVLAFFPETKGVALEDMDAALGT